MTHISRTKTGQFIVAVLGKNGKVLMTSEPLKTRQAAIKNVAAVANDFNDWGMYVQDNTGDKPAMIFVSYNKSVDNVSIMQPSKPYQPK